MAAEVSSLVRLMKGGDAAENGGVGGGRSASPITRDLLGLGRCCSSIDSKELDLDSQVPSGWEKRLDLKSGKVYLQKCNSSPSTSDHHKQKPNQTVAKLHDLNFPPSSKQPLSLFDDSTLDLKLVTSPPPSRSSHTNYQSVCTLDKVKLALERAERETVTRKRPISLSKSCSSPSSSSSSVEVIDSCRDDQSLAAFAAGCPSCLLYVVISKNNPKCPRCNTMVPSPMMVKKPRIDLNISI